MPGLYIHVPFCENKCPYCDFYSEKIDNFKLYAWKEAVIRNLKFYGEVYDTVYFGGGTPSLAWYEICEIMGEVKRTGNPEVTVEANPRTISVESLNAMRDSGINRLSFGAQSLNVLELRSLGRKHSPDDVISSITLAAEMGFSNISADFMLGIPGQSAATIRNSFHRLIDLPVTHISAYLLKIEQNTPYATSTLRFPNEDTQAEMYHSAAECAEKLGFRQYEISNFAKPGYECRHNVKYWHSEEYIGIGPSAHSYYKKARFFVPRDLTAFTANEFQPVSVTENKVLTFSEFAMLRLRLNEGLSFADCEKFGVSPESITEKAQLIPPECLNITPDKIALTRQGFAVSNQIITKLVF